TAGGYALSFPLRPPPGWEQPSAATADGEVECSALRAEVEALAAGMEPAGGGRVASVSGQVSPLPLGPDVTAGADDTKINLWSTAHRLDKAPLLPGCGCFACRRHSRAYVHHLLNTHEMLAEVLLEAHNTSHMQAFCQAVREAVAEGRFEQFRAWFRSLRAMPLVAPSRPPGGKRRALVQEAAAGGDGEETGEGAGGVGSHAGAQAGQNTGRA
ncbi:Queuine tRNA-ribosyltransferase subunit QTRTD1, partial [Tetrabaena socialis]